MKQILALVLLGLPLNDAAANDGDETLKSYLAKSEIVVYGEVTSPARSYTTEAGVVHYTFRFQIIESIQGEAAAGRTIEADVVRFEFAEEDRLDIAEKSRCILLLVKSSPGNRPEWRTADPWFGFQPAQSALRQSLKRLASEVKK